MSLPTSLALREDFNPRPPRGGRLWKALCWSRPILISIHALREEGDNGFRKVLYWSKEFQSTPSARRATKDGAITGFDDFISIHALREEGDLVRDGPMLFCRKFQSTPSARRATARRGRTAGKQLFQSTPSARRATPAFRPDAGGKRISIHALREEGDLGLGLCLNPGIKISIHALREEGDRLPACARKLPAIFQSTPSARRATHQSAFCRERRRNFNPRPPRGGRPGCNAGHNLSDVFQSTPSARRATLHFPYSGDTSCISIHALREEGDAAAGFKVTAGAGISIHALREEGDGTGSDEETFGYQISIHALREEGDCRIRQREDWTTNFNPRPPRGGRLV